MTTLMTLACPACGAEAKVSGDANDFSCEHCGNRFLLKNQAQKMSATERKNLQPLATYAHQLGQWLKAGDYEICVHDIFEEQVKNQWMVYINVEYRNNSDENLSCRVGQWIMYDTEGYSYDSVSQSAYFGDKGRPRLNERVIAPGMRVRGWMAFKKPTQDMERLQFLSGYVGKHTVDFLLK